MNIDVIIPSLTLPEHSLMLKNCIDSLRKSEEDHYFNIIIVESSEYYFDYGQDKTLLSPKPFNYNECLDLGIKNSNNDWIVMANNDLIFEKNWFSEILNVKNNRDDITSFSSWNNFGNWHNNRIKNNDEIIMGFGIGFELCGWILVIKRTDYLKLNIVNDITFWCSDNVYKDELIRCGFTHALIRKSVVNHLTSQTLFNNKVDVKNLTEDQANKYANRNNNINL